MRSMWKHELADKAGVSVKTLKNWCMIYREELTIMGIKPTAKKLPPHAVEWLSEKFCIDL